MPGAMKHQTALLLGRLGRDKSHGWQCDAFANRFRISRIVLLPFVIGFHVGGRHQAHGVAQRLKFTRPIMRRRTGLDTNEARRQLLKERPHIPPLQLTAKHNIAIRINAVDLKNRLRDIETDSRNRSHDLAPPNHRRLTAPTSHGALAPVEEPSTASIPDARVAKTNAGKRLLWCLLISGSEMLMSRPRHR